MSIAEEFSLFHADPFGEGVTADLELTVAVRATETCSMEEQSVGAHPLHEVDTLGAEVAEVA